MRQMTSTLPREGQELLEHLQRTGHLSEDQAAIVITESRLSGRSVAVLVVDLGFIEEDALYTALSALCGYPLTSLDAIDVLPNLTQRIPYEVALSTCSFPIEEDTVQKKLVCAMADPSDLRARDELTRFLAPGEQLSLVMAKKSEILSCIQNHLPHRSFNSDASFSEDATLHALLHNLITQAVAEDASDIHFQPHKVFVSVRFRVDGLLRNVCSFHFMRWEVLCNQIKVLASMDITETRRPQDGRFSLVIMGRSIRFRVSSHPTIYGESVVLRSLEKNIALTQLHNLGYSEQALEKINQMLKKPEGLVVITGPTGSGKTTSLYSMLGLLDTTHLNIMTLEEPVEYRLPYARQSEVKENSSLTFVTGMHSILRQDPDVILLGEIRDAQTAHMAVRASMTGHKVFTTLHTNSAWGAIQRFLDFQVTPSLFTGLFNGIIAQRLVRLLCPSCKKKRILTTEEAKAFRIWPQLHLYEAVGCPACARQGYKGRRAVAEIVVMDVDLEALVTTAAPPIEVRYALQQRGIKTLFEEGMQVVLAGETTLEELYRVVGTET